MSLTYFFNLFSFLWMESAHFMEGFLRFLLFLNSSVSIERFEFLFCFRKPCILHDHLQVNKTRGLWVWWCFYRSSTLVRVISLVNLNAFMLIASQHDSMRLNCFLGDPHTHTEQTNHFGFLEGYSGLSHHHTQHPIEWSICYFLIIKSPKLHIRSLHHRFHISV